MWTLRQVYAKNLCAFKQLDYTLLQNADFWQQYG